MFRDSLRASIAHVGLALREPELFALRYRDGERSYRPAVWVALAATAVLGTTTYGMTMGMLGGANEMASRAAFFTFAAGLAWAIPLPTLYIFNSLSGSRLSASTTLLAVLVSVSWGGLAMIASVPINWFFNVSMPLILPGQFVPYALALVNLAVFTGVGVSMIDVFGRVMERLEPQRGRAPLWCLGLVAVIGAELFCALGLFNFGFVSAAV